MSYDLLVIGGGAAGFFGAIHAVLERPGMKVAILERGKDVLSKVRISGGGRCNVTHAEYDPRMLATNYPRGAKELLGPFHSFGCGDTQEFFESRGIPLKVEEDGRIFPVSDTSEDIINCLLKETDRLGIEVHTRQAVRRMQKTSGGWVVRTDHDEMKARKVLVASGSNPKIWEMLEDLGHTIISPVPSLFTFNIKDPRISGLQGLAVPASIRILPIPGLTKGEVRENLERSGPLLITHWGLSGPAVLKLSAWGARLLHACNYNFKVQVNWIPDEDLTTIGELLMEGRKNYPKKLITNAPVVEMPRRLWERIVLAAVPPNRKWAELSKEEAQELGRALVAAEFQVKGKSTFKEEFVTAGGVKLREVDFRTFESRIAPGLFLAGEVLDIDAITGGFNFQNAWTGAFMAARAISTSLEKERE